MGQIVKYVRDGRKVSVDVMAKGHEKYYDLCQRCAMPELLCSKERLLGNFEEITHTRIVVWECPNFVEPGAEKKDE